MYCIKLNMLSNKRKKIIINYFNYFNKQDILNLSKLFSQNIHLKDWEIDVKGKTQVIKANQNIFDQFPRIKVKIIKLFQIRNYIFAIIKIRLNKNKTIEVVDQFQFNPKNLISNIRAYLG